MPTGFTHRIADGTETSLRQFALRCARGMGALITMRDDPHDAPIPTVLAPDTEYHDNGLAQANEELDRLRQMTSIETAGMAAAEYDEQLERWKQRRHDNTARYDRYTMLIHETELATNLPDGLQKFMLSQLEESRRFDCASPDDAKYDPKPTPMTGEQWRAQRIAKAARDYAYHIGEIQKEIDRTAERNAWLAQLHTALKGLPE